mgnify:CR=1 FL=1
MVFQKKNRDITGTNIPSLDQNYAEMEELSSKILKNKKKGNIVSIKRKILLLTTAILSTASMASAQSKNEHSERTNLPVAPSTVGVAAQQGSVDINGDGKISEEDKTNIGDPYSATIFFAAQFAIKTSPPN